MNGFTSSFVLPDEHYQNFLLVDRRDGKKELMTCEAMESHANKFYDATREILTAFDMTYDDIVAYLEWIAENAPTPQARQKRRSKLARTIYPERD